MLPTAKLFPYTLLSVDGLERVGDWFNRHALEG